MQMLGSAVVYGMDGWDDVSVLELARNDAVLWNFRMIQLP